jgi:hypothetical protein
MKRPAKTNKVFKGFKLHPKMIRDLEKESARTGRTQTKTLEMALGAWLSVKR